jgi:hypothetical protein
MLRDCHCVCCPAKVLKPLIIVLCRFEKWRVCHGSLSRSEAGFITAKRAFCPATASIHRPSGRALFLALVSQPPAAREHVQSKAALIQCGGEP